MTGIERLRELARACEDCGHSSWECSYDKARDLVRRAKALAERGA